MVSFTKRNSKLLIVTSVVAITSIVFTIIGITYATDTNTIFTRDQLSELVNEQNQTTIDLENILSELANINVYLNNELVDSLDDSKQYKVTSYSCNGDEIISESSDFKGISIKNYSKDSICNVYLENYFEKLYTYETSDFQTFITPYTGNYKIELWGASGLSFLKFDGLLSNYLGGNGAYVSGIINLSEDVTLYIYVGQSGMINGTNGYNGGGSAAASGGGATDVRLINGLWSNNTSLNSRIMVAGGGGAAYDRGGGYGGGNGGSGGGLQGYDGISLEHTNEYGYGYGLGGSQTSISLFRWFNSGTAPVESGDYASDPFKTNRVSGIFGAGGVGASNQSGGGSGYYGGAGASHGGAGGGSSYISGHTGCVAITATNNSTPKAGCAENNTTNSCSIHPSGKVFTSTIMIDGNGYSWTNVKSSSYMPMPNPLGGFYHEGYGNVGHGYAKITFIG